MERLHRSVMCTQVLEMLDIKSGGKYLDGTFGEGGHTEAILDSGASSVIGIDRDLRALDKYRSSGKFRNDSRLQLIHANYFQDYNFSSYGPFDGALLDLGVSTVQLLTPERGFSFSKNGPLDMRMGEGPTLKEKLSDATLKDLVDAFALTGIPRPKDRARVLLKAFQQNPEMGTEELAQVFGPKFGPKHPATPYFLALRMWVNEELTGIEKGIPKIVEMLKPGGRLVVLSFHSTEDRLVKHTLKHLAGQCVCENDPCTCSPLRLVHHITKKPLIPTREEMRDNPRSRSTKLRCVEKLDSEAKPD